MIVGKGTRHGDVTRTGCSCVGGLAVGVAILGSRGGHVGIISASEVGTTRAPARNPSDLVCTPLPESTVTPLRLLAVAVCVLLPLPIIQGQGESRPTSRTTSDSRPASRDRADRRARRRAHRDLVIPPLEGEVHDAGDGITWCLIRRARRKRRLLEVGDTIKVHITAWDKKKWDDPIAPQRVELLTTRKRDDAPRRKPAELDVGMLPVEAFNRVFPKLRIGDKVRIDTPAKWAFGPRPMGPIPPNTDLIYAVEVLEVIRSIEVPEPQQHRFDEAKAVRIDERRMYQTLAEGEGEPIGPHGIVIYDFLSSNSEGRILSYSRMRKGNVFAGQAGRMRADFASKFSPGAREGSQFLVRTDMRGTNRPLAALSLGDPPFHFLQFNVRRLIRFEPRIDDMKKSESGLAFRIERPGKGKEIKPTHHVVMHYAWWLPDGTLIEASYARGSRNTLWQVALPRGMVEGIRMLRPGGKIWMQVPAELAWGSRGRPGVPSGSPVVMLVEVFDSKQLDPLPKRPNSRPTTRPDKSEKKSADGR